MLEGAGQDLLFEIHRQHDGLLVVVGLETRHEKTPPAFHEVSRILTHFGVFLQPQRERNRLLLERQRKKQSAFTHLLCI
jgi:hypothetical protein